MAFTDLELSPTSPDLASQEAASKEAREARAPYEVGEGKENAGTSAKDGADKGSSEARAAIISVREQQQEAPPLPA